MALLILAFGCAKERPVSRGPIVIISVDTLRADHLPAYGYGGVRTPNIDALAKGGIVFDEAWSNVPLTLPSHVSMLTGALPAQNGVRNNLGYRFDAAAHPTIPALLKSRGYATGAAVSAYVLRGSTGLSGAFDWYDDAMDDSEGASVADLQRSGMRTVAAARQWIDANRSKPFFFLLHVYEPHAPYAPPEPFRTQYAGHEYDGEIAAADAAVGAFVQFLRERKLYDDATIVFMSDHGEGLGDHGESQHGIFLYREAIHVPLILKLPRSEHGGTRVSTPVELIDLLPTIAEIAGLHLQTKPAGRSLMAIAAGEKPDRRIFSETMYPRIHLGLSDLASLIDGSHHYIDAPRAELFDMKSDPAEKQNLAASERRMAAAMKGEIGRFDRTLAAPTAISGEEAAKLSALGYLSATAPAAASGDPKDAIADIESVGAAANLTESGRAADAVAMLRGVVERNPRFADAWSQLGRACERAGRVDESIAAYRRALEISPMLVDEAAISLAQSYLEVGQFDEAIAHAKIAVAAHPGAAHAVLARALLSKGDFAAAASEAEWLINDPARHVEGLVAMAQVRIAESRLDEAVALVEKARLDASKQDDKRVPLLAFVRGDLLAKRGDIAGAKRAFLEEIASFPRDREAYVRLAALDVLQGDVAGAERIFEQMVNATPGRSSILLAADAFEKLGKGEIAARWRARAGAR